MSTQAPTTILRDGHPTRIKWHRARRRADDPVFTTTRIVEGMRVGASIEIDLVIHAGRGYAVLHDRDVAGATTGTGEVSGLPADHIRTLFLRDNDGRPLDQPVLLLEDLADLLDTTPIHPNALLQLDFKEFAHSLDSAAIDIFAGAVTPFARHAILSCGDAEAVRLLTEPVPGIRIGYDPCHDGAVDRVLHTGRFGDFVYDAIAASPHAEMVYLERRLINQADRRGVDLVDAFHRTGRTVDAYTVHIVDDEAIREVDRLLDLHVDQITTDDPERLVAVFS